MASSASEHLAERPAEARASTVQEHPLVGLADVENVTDVLGAPPLPASPGGDPPPPPANSANGNPRPSRVALVRARFERVWKNQVMKEERPWNAGRPRSTAS